MSRIIRTYEISRVKTEEVLNDKTLTLSFLSSLSYLKGALLSAVTAPAKSRAEFKLNLMLAVDKVLREKIVV